MSSTVTIVVAGVGYKISIPDRATYRELSGISTLYTYLSVRDTALELYGFLQESELTIFELLIRIPKVGPKKALQILSKAEPQLLCQAVAEQDPTILKKQAGISDKMSAEIVKHLEDCSVCDSTTHNPEVSTMKDAYDALTTLGYQPGAVRDFLRHQDQADPAATLIQKALQEL